MLIVARAKDERGGRNIRPAATNGERRGVTRASRRSSDADARSPTQTRFRLILQRKPSTSGTSLGADHYRNRDALCGRAPPCAATVQQRTPALSRPDRSAIGLADLVCRACLGPTGVTLHPPPGTQRPQRAQRNAERGTASHAGRARCAGRQSESVQTNSEFGAGARLRC